MLHYRQFSVLVLDVCMFALGCCGFIRLLTPVQLTDQNNTSSKSTTCKL